MDSDEKQKIDERLLAFYNSIVDNALKRKEYKAALGISIETMRIDMVF